MGGWEDKVCRDCLSVSVCVGVVIMRVFEGVLTCITMPVERVGG